MKCTKCGTELRQVVRGINVAYPHVCKAFKNPAADILNVGGVGADWAPPVYGEYYARSIPIYSAIKIRADNVVRPPLVVYRQDADGEKTPVEETHPAQMLLSKVNSWWTRGDLWRATSTYLDLWGSAYWLLNKTSPSSPPTEIWPMRPDRMKILTDPNKYIVGFEYDHNHIKKRFRPDEIMWFRYFNPLEEFGGMSPVAPVRLSVDMGIEAYNHNRRIFQNGMLWGNIALVSKDGSLTPEQRKEIQEDIDKRYSTTKNSHRPLILGQLDPKNLGMTNKDMEFVESLKRTISDVSMVYGVPESMLGGMKDTTFANMDAAERMFWRNTMVSLLMFLQEEINEMLMPQFGDASLICKFDLSKIEALQEDKDAESVRNERDVRAGIRTINEVRADLGLEPVPWGDEPPVLGSAFGQQQEMGAPTDEDMEPRAYRKYKKDWSDHALGSIAELHARALNRNEKSFLTLQHTLFEEQKQDVLKRIASRDRKAMPEFNIKDWVRRFTEKGRPFYVAALEQSAQQQASAFKLGITFNPATEAVKNWLSDRTSFWAQRVNEETSRLLMQEMEDGYANGESIKQLQARVEKVFKFSDTIRSEMIARTEIQAATNNGAYQAYKQSGVVESKMWLATLDGRTRDAHAAVHRQVVPLEADFEVGGEMVAHPGAGSAANVINCRCTLVPIISTAKMLKALSPAPAIVQPKTKTTRKQIIRDKDGTPSEIVETHTDA